MATIVEPGTVKKILARLGLPPYVERILVARDATGDVTAATGLFGENLVIDQHLIGETRPIAETLQIRALRLEVARRRPGQR